MIEPGFKDQTPTPLVSIGIPTYNRPEGLRKTLDSITRQSYKNLEIIVSDNGSTGTLTEDVVRGFMSNDPRISYYRQPQNMGPTYNFQFVFDKATGTYFTWAADDDWKELTFVSELVSLLEKEKNASLAFCDFQAIDPGGMKITTYPEFLPLLKKFAGSSQTVNLANYIFQKESKGKANLFYSIYRRGILSSFDITGFVNEYGPWGVDMLFVFQMLCKGRLVLSENNLHKCTAGNVKRCEADVKSGAGEATDEKRAMTTYWEGYSRIVDSHFSGYERAFFRSLVWLRMHFFSST